MKFFKISLSAFTALMLITNSNADDLSELKVEVAKLKAQTQALIEESSNLQTGFNYTTANEENSYTNMGGAASKVYYSNNPLSIGGYGEMFYSSTSTASNDYSSKVDVYRFVPYIGYKFSDDIVLNTEIEFEHGGVTPDEGGEVIVEFMYLDFLINKSFNLRTGNMLIPMGLINERHEPTLFNTVQRPSTAKYLIPSTWHESGVMTYGEIMDGIEYKISGITALKPEDNGDKWLRNGRGGSFENTNPKLGTVARVDYTAVNGLLAGASVYNDSNLFMWDIHTDYKMSGVRVYGTYTQTTRQDATATQVKKANGGYINASFDILSLNSSDKQLPIFIQMEQINPQAELGDGTKGDKTTNVSVGLNYFPHPQVVLKTDYVASTKNNTTDTTTSVSMGYIF